MHTKGVLIPRLSRISYTFWKIRKATLSENNTSKRVICGVLCHLRLPTEDNRFSKERNREETLSQLREKSWMSLVTSVNKLNWIEKDCGKLVSGVKNWLDVMEKSSCELLSGSYKNYVSELENLRWTILVNLVFNNFLTYTTIMLNVVTIYAMRKTSVIVAKHSEDTAPESRCYRCWCWINCSTSLLLAPGQVVAKEYWRLQFQICICYAFVDVLPRFVLGCCGC